MEPFDLVGLVASRICHDFAGPVGAISNGIELLAEEQDADVRAEFTAMLASAASKLAVRVRLYRLMVGSGNDRDIVQILNARGELADFLGQESKISLDWRIDGATLTRVETRLLLSLAMLGAETMSRGGTLRIARTPGSAPKPDGWTVRAEGPRAALTADTMSVLNNEPLTDAGSRAALAYYAHAVAERLGVTISVEAREGAVLLLAT